MWRSARIYSLGTLLGALLHVSHIGWTYLLTPEEYGRFANLQVLFNFVCVPITLAPYAFAIAHYHRLPKQAFAAALGSLLPINALLLATAILAIIWIPRPVLDVFGADTPRWAFAITCTAAALIGPKRMALGIAEARGRAIEASAWLEVGDGLRPVIALLAFILLGMRWESRLTGLVIAQGGSGILALFLLHRAGHLASPSIQKAPLSKTLKFILPSMGTALVYVTYDSADRLFVTHFHGLEAAGRYDLAYRIALLVQTANAVFRRSVTPLLYKACAEGKFDEVERLLHQTSRRLLRVTVPLALVIPALLGILPVVPESYQMALWVVPIVAVGASFWGVQVLWQQVLLAEGLTTIVFSITAAGAVLNLALNLLLVPRYGTLGAAAATLGCFMLMYVLVRAAAGRLLKKNAHDY
ncbi:MAG: polysaccharide biosynthesis C-terminal domain-containing protein [Myxococcota bacterium]